MTWRILLRRIDLQPDKVRTIVLTTAILHNILRENRDPPTGASLDPVRNDILGDVEEHGVRANRSSMVIRDMFKSYVNKNPVLYA